MTTVRLGCNTAGFLRQPLERALDGIAALGIVYVEFGSIPGYIEHVLPDRKTPEPSALRAALESRGLKAVSVSAGADLATPEGFAYIESWLRYGQELGLEFINTGTGPGTPSERGAAVLENLRRLAPVAESTGVYVALETQDDLTAYADAASELLESVGSDWVCLNLDAANMLYWQGVDPMTEIDALAPFIRHVHLKDKIGGKGDYNFPPLGEGEIDWAAILRVLLDAGFSGPIVLDPELWREEAKTPAEVAESKVDPAMTYRRPHGYLGVDDATIVDRYVETSLRTTEALFASLGIRTAG
jgi:L-ribulose-5-phosphate 3-epimerase